MDIYSYIIHLMQNLQHFPAPDILLEGSALDLIKVNG